jgi:hypothetical protein
MKLRLGPSHSLIINLRQIRLFSTTHAEGQRLLTWLRHVAVSVWDKAGIPYPSVCCDRNNALSRTNSTSPPLSASQSHLILHLCYQASPDDAVFTWLLLAIVASSSVRGGVLHTMSRSAAGSVHATLLCSHKVKPSRRPAPLVRTAHIATTPAVGQLFPRSSRCRGQS